jgi:hypothetical protein
VELTGTTELCYNLRFVQHNGRTEGDPWSLRQIGVYQKYEGTTRRSVWIFISASDVPQQAIEAVRQSNAFDLEPRLSGIVAFHAALLETAALEWHTYLESLNAQIELLV